MTLNDILCKESKKYNSLNKDFKQLMKDIKALKELTKNIREKQKEYINEYAKSKMIGKCYKFIKDGYIKYIHIVGYEMIEDKPHIVYERKYQGRINNIDTIKTSTDLLDIMFINVEEITRDEYDTVIIKKIDKNEELS